jgi:hypothetical protein
MFYIISHMEKKESKKNQINCIDDFETSKI